LYVQLQRQGVACCNETTLTQCTILTEVGRGGPLTLIELGQRVGLGKSWTSRAVQRLVEEGLLLKTAGATDRRNVILRLSPAGEQRYQALNQLLNTQSEQVLGRVPAAEQENVVRALEFLLAALRRELNQPSTLSSREETP
jgi:DNA-binding MarR family transcriptional regulator